MKKISIVIVTYNSKRLIGDCLESIFKYNDIGDELEVIVVDNHSGEGYEMFEYIVEQYGDTIILRDSGKNGGYGFGNNVGVNIASAPILIVMNPDVRLVSPVFRTICERMSQQSIGMLGVDFVDGSAPYYFKRESLSLYHLLMYKRYLRKRCYNPSTMFMSGSFLVFKKEVFKKVGLFDENLFMYSEEADVTNRFLMNGYEVVWEKNIKVLHLAHNREINPRLEEIRMQSGLYYEKKYGINSYRYYRNYRYVLTIKILYCLLTNKKEQLDRFKLQLQIHNQFYAKCLNY